jgi:hypothetical protein
MASPVLYAFVVALIFRLAVVSYVTATLRNNNQEIF